MSFFVPLASLRSGSGSHIKSWVRSLWGHYRALKLMRIPLVDAQMIQDTERFKMDLVGGLERTLHGKVKPSMCIYVTCYWYREIDAKYPLVITQCSIRHLYTIPYIPAPQKDALVAIARSMERRRCNHHTLEDPLSTLECLSSVIDPKNSKTNKNRYVVASQEDEVRRYCRGVKGVPLVYVKRSVMVMEPMADSSVDVREVIEKEKFRSGLRAKGQAADTKRKREDVSDIESGNIQDSEDVNNFGEANEGQATKRKRTRGPKGPNPLSMKKSRKPEEHRARRDKQEKKSEQYSARKTESPLAGVQPGIEADEPQSISVDIIEGALDENQNPPAKRKRKRKHKSASFRDLGDKGHDDGEGNE